MEIIIAKTAGFCFGVKRAVDLAFNTTSEKPTFTLGPIIHNDSVVNKLKNKGISPIETIGDNEVDTLIIRSHGVALDVYEEAKQKNIQIVDATCPYVTKIHKLVQKYFNQGYKILLVGNDTHPEIIGINGWGNNECVIIQDVQDEKLVSLDPNEKYLVVSQTTYKKQVVEEIINHLTAKGYTYEYINTICNATKERQDEALEIAKQVEGMIVVGSSYSSNTQKLYEICKKECPNTHCIPNVETLELEFFKDCKKIGITAGASAPSDIIEEIIQAVQKLGEL
ncbi:MAG: 4-hydroxy-3-methylbut-2-enyl diphosphate reductase [Cellulosilyticaceae bacterium]